MTVHQALWERFSCRCFLNKPVEPQLLEAVLGDAMRSPSCENSQPWEVFVAGPQAMERLRQEVEACRKEKQPQDLNRRFDGNWTPEMQPRIDAYFDGICAHEPRKNFDYTMQKRQLFYAPAMVYLCLPEGLPTWSVFDTGIFAQSLMLSATEHGLASIASAVSVAYPQAVRKVLGIPQKFWPVIGIGLGYPDPQAPVNHFRTDRRGMEQIHRLP